MSLSLLPSKIELYHLGDVVPSEGSTLSQDERVFSDYRGIAGFLYKVEADHAAWLGIIFPEGLESSVYAELGNIMASQLATALSQRAHDPVLISPPQPVSSQQIERLSRSNLEILRRKWHHHSPTGTVSIETWWIESQDSKGVADA